MQDKIQEIMGLVEEMVGYDSRVARHMCLVEIQSKLREFVEQTTIQKPLSDEQMETLIEKHAPPIHPDFSEDDDFDELVRAVERAHGITKGI